MKDPNSPSLHGWAQPQDFGGGFPGVGNPDFGGDPFFSGPPAMINPTVLPPQGIAGGTKGNFSLADLKSFIDRMGGVDGVLNGLGKFQKFMSTMQQMAPLFRVFLGKGAAAATKAAEAGTSGGYRPKNRRKTRKRGNRNRQRRR